MPSAPRSARRAGHLRKPVAMTPRVNPSSSGGSPPAERQSLLRRLPGVDEVARRLESEGAAEIPRALLLESVRAALDLRRRQILESPDHALNQIDCSHDAIVRDARERLAGLHAFSLDRVINATGVVLHTNLGRALLASEALDHLHRIAAAYSNLELDLVTKERGSRYVHVEGRLRRLTGAEAALVVNNNAAAVLLALETLARGREVIVSRGELIEIGGEFRIPEILARSGARLREVGTTNRTHLRDYAEAIGPDTALLMKVHSSNYRVLGFTASVSTRELTVLGKERGIPVIEDLGSGSFLDLTPHGLPHEPTVQATVAAGVDLVTFSGDKLLGGPQAGIVVGRQDLVTRLAKNPLNRALRIDKLTLAALEATLRLYDDPEHARQAIPTLRMLTEPASLVARRARRCYRRIPVKVAQSLSARVREDTGQVGGGALPLAELPTMVLALGNADFSAHALDERLRRGRPPVIGRVKDDRLLLDFRTVQDADLEALARAVTRLVETQHDA